MTNWLDGWRSCSVPARVAIIVLLICAIQFAGVVIYSFLLPVTG